jgi:hypothetical protein
MPFEKWMRKYVCLTLLLGVCGANLVFAQESPPQILFLHLKLQSNQVSLVSASVTPGKLKVFPEHRAALDLEVTTSAGQVLWTNSVADPSFRHLEYEDPDHPGQIISKEVQLTNAEFTVRVPVIRDAHHVNFFLSRSSAETNAAGANPLTAHLPSPQRMDLGSVVLPPTTQ